MSESGAVEAKCVDHFDEVATGTCKRCGSFLCGHCTPVGQCQACLSRPEAQPQPRRIGGWLILAVVSLFSLPLSALSHVITLGLQLRKYGGVGPILEADPAWLAITVIETTYSTSLAVYGFFVLPGFFRKLKITVTRMQWLYAAVLVGNVLFTVFETIYAGNTEPAKPNYLIFIVPILWLNYFRSSKRVKETFIR